jgi:hypothetical protein
MLPSMPLPYSAVIRQPTRPCPTTLKWRRGPYDQLHPDLFDDGRIAPLDPDRQALDQNGRPHSLQRSSPSVIRFCSRS